MTGFLQPSCSDSFFFLPASDRSQALSPEPEFFPANAVPFEERELVDVCSFADDEEVEIGRIVDVQSPPAGAEPGGQRNGNGTHCNGHCGCLSEEAPSKIECRRAKNCSVSSPVQLVKTCRRGNCRLGKQHSFPSDIDREEAWERKKELYGMEELSNQTVHGGGKRFACAVLRSVSDCGERAFSLDKTCAKARTRSLTDDDLEELRGCIDLGFGFSAEKDCDQSGILPALELYYAINRQYLESKSRTSPASPCETSSVLSRTSSNCSNGSPISDSWKISSPGDTPSQVKTRLRHWAQAVACSIKQGFSL